MNFMEAVTAMKEGKQVRRKGWKKEYVFNAGINFYIFIHNKNDYYKPDTISVEATDWEVVVDDKDWNLMSHRVGLVNNENIKKCRDLILKDLKSFDNGRRLIQEIINKRFGEL